MILLVGNGLVWADEPAVSLTGAAPEVVIGDPAVSVQTMEQGMDQLQSLVTTMQMTDETIVERQLAYVSTVEPSPDPAAVERKEMTPADRLAALESAKELAQEALRRHEVEGMRGIVILTPGQINAYKNQIAQIEELIEQAKQEGGEADIAKKKLEEFRDQNDSQGLQSIDLSDSLLKRKEELQAELNKLDLQVGKPWLHWDKRLLKIQIAQIDFLLGIIPRDI